MSNTQAFAAFDATSPLKPFEFSRREPGPRDVQIDILYCGVCHSDLHTINGDWGRANYPLVPGHEIVGKVSRVGSEVKKFRLDQNVGVGCMVDSCRTCDSCEHDLEQYCEVGGTFTYGSPDKRGGGITQGGYSTRITVDEHFVVNIPDGIPLQNAAPLLCAGITTYSPLKHWDVKAGQKVAVAGLGGLGHMGVKIARAMGAEVSVLSHSENKRESAMKLGAHQLYVMKNAEHVKAMQSHFDFILNTISAEHDYNSYLDLLKRDGVMVVVGLPGPQPVSAFGLVGKRGTLAGSLIGGIAETQEMLDFCAKHRISADIEMISIQQINDAYKRMVKGDVHYRFVIDSASLR